MSPCAEVTVSPSSAGQEIGVADGATVTVEEPETVVVVAMKVVVTLLELELGDVVKVVGTVVETTEVTVTELGGAIEVTVTELGEAIEVTVTELGGAMEVTVTGLGCCEVE